MQEWQITHLRNKKVKIFTRAATTGARRSARSPRRFPASTRRTRSSTARSWALKGGLSDFHLLRRELGQPNPEVVYQAFDLLWFDGEDLLPPRPVFSTRPRQWR